MMVMIERIIGEGATFAQAVDFTASQVEAVQTEIHICHSQHESSM
jgi:hypothetical protein